MTPVTINAACTNFMFPDKRWKAVICAFEAAFPTCSRVR